VTLLLGGPGRPSPAEEFARADVPHPTDLAVVSTGDEQEVYVTEEGQESVLLLTAFGVPVPAVAEPVPPLPGVFVVNGPGFETGLDIPTAGGASPGPASVPTLADLPDQSPDTAASSSGVGKEPASPGQHRGGIPWAGTGPWGRRGWGRRRRSDARRWGPRQGGQRCRLHDRRGGCHPPAPPRGAARGTRRRSDCRGGTRSGGMAGRRRQSNSPGAYPRHCRPRSRSPAACTPSLRGEEVLPLHRSFPAGLGG
jgi:hypothetical protein